MDVNTKTYNMYYIFLKIRNYIHLFHGHFTDNLFDKEE